MVYIGKSVKEKLVTKIENELNPLLPKDEKIVAVFWANRLRPLTDALVLTNQRLLCANSAKIGQPNGFISEIVANDIKSVDLEKSFAGPKLSLTRNDGTKELLPTILKADYENIVKVIDKMSGSPQPLNYAEQKKEQIAAEAELKTGTKVASEAEWSIRITGKVNSASLREVQQSCRPGEMPEFILGDGANGVLAAFNDRCIIIKKGLGTSFMAGSFGGGRTATFAYRDITGIEYNSGMLAGVLEILTASYSGKATNSPWAFGSDRSAHESSNTLPWDKSFYNRVRPQIEWMQQKIHEAKTAASPLVTTQVSASDELSKLAALHKQGILTDTEFVEAKKKILSML